MAAMFTARRNVSAVLCCCHNVRLVCRPSVCHNLHKPVGLLYQKG